MRMTGSIQKMRFWVIINGRRIGMVTFFVGVFVGFLSGFIIGGLLMRAKLQEAKE